MHTEEIIEQAKLFFGKDRRHLKKKVLAFEFDGKEYRNWIKALKQVTSQPFDLSYKIFDDVSDWLKTKNYKEIDWHWLGDLCWEFNILLNEGVVKGLDWDKRLAIACGGTARILQIYVSDIIPCFVINTYYMTYDKKENYYEFGPLHQITVKEKEIISTAKKFFQDSGFTFVSKKLAAQKYTDLYSDCNSDGNATIFDALFSDTSFYQTETKRFNDTELIDPTGKKINWTEYYDKNHKLIKREEYRYFSSKNTECVITDSKNQIIKVTVWRDIENNSRREFVLDVLKEYEKEKGRKKTRKKTARAGQEER